MHILFLGRADCPVRHFLEQTETKVTWTDRKLDEDFLRSDNFDFLVSYNYRYILRRNILDYFPNAAVNLHISFLPWNRGRDPNFWSFVDGTPKGISIHYIDEGVDTGDIIFQKEIEFCPTDTLASSYARLQQEIQSLFCDNWRAIRDGRCPRTKQPSGGTAHKAADIAPLLYLLADGWETPISVLEEYRGVKALSNAPNSGNKNKD